MWCTPVLQIAHPFDPAAFAIPLNEGSRFERSKERTRYATLSAATVALARNLSQNNGGLQQAGKLQALTLGRQMANAVELRGRSGVVDGGTRLLERDWLVTIARPDGDLNYIVFVAPEPDFEAMRPVFTAMMQSFVAE